MGAALAKATKAKKKTADLENILKEMNMVKIIRMTGRKKAPGLRTKDW